MVDIIRLDDDYDDDYDDDDKDDDDDDDKDDDDDDDDDKNMTRDLWIAFCMLGSDDHRDRCGGQRAGFNAARGNPR